MLAAVRGNAPVMCSIIDLLYVVVLAIARPLR
jgi:hypothetical protein